MFLTASDRETIEYISSWSRQSTENDIRKWHGGKWEKWELIIICFANSFFIARKRYDI